LTLSNLNQTNEAYGFVLFVGLYLKKKKEEQERDGGEKKKENLVVSVSWFLFCLVVRMNAKDPHRILLLILLSTSTWFISTFQSFLGENMNNFIVIL